MTQSKNKAAEPAAEDTAVEQGPAAGEGAVATPPAFDPVLFDRIMAAKPTNVTVSHDPASPEAIRLECLRVALGRGMNRTTADGKKALREAVDDYFAIVMDRPFPVREAPKPEQDAANG